MHRVNILGSEWDIVCRDEKEEPLLNGTCRDGYTDPSARLIVVCNKRGDCELQDYEGYKKSVIRHELLHAFLYESGLDSSSLDPHEAWAMNEEMVDWFAIQSPKIFRIFQELNIL